MCSYILCEKWPQLAANFALPVMPIRPNLCRSASWVLGLWNFYYHHHLPKDLKLDAIAMKVTFQFWVSVSVLGSWDGQTESQVRSSTNLKVSPGSWPADQVRLRLCCTTPTLVSRFIPTKQLLWISLEVLFWISPRPCVRCNGHKVGWI